MKSVSGRARSEMSVIHAKTPLQRRISLINALTFGVLIFAASYLVILCHQLIDVAFEGSEKAPD